MALPAVVPQADPRASVYVARQPILDAAGHVFGYELLYRGAGGDTICDAPQDLASARVLNDALLAVGLDTLTGGRRAFMNITRHVLLSDFATLLPADAVVLELLENTAVDDEVIHACRRLRDIGYLLALDDYTLDSPAEALLPHANIVKVDMLATTVEEREKIRASLPTGVKLLAEKVESADVFDEAVSTGYQLFQGYYFCRPATFAARAVSGRQAAYARLLAALNKPDATVSEIEDLIKHDTSLSYRVLRCINAASFGIRQQLHSIRQALLLLGLDQVRKWASVWALAGLNGRSNGELVTMALVRARSCELLAESMLGRDASSEYFLLGLCSLLDAMLQRPMDEAVAELPVSDNIRNALLGEPNASRLVLDAVTAYERGLWDVSTTLLDQMGVNADALPVAYAEALQWARELSHTTA